MRRKPATNRFNLKFKHDYTKLGERRRLSTMIRDDLLTQFEEIAYLSNNPMSKMIDVMLIDILESKESVKIFLDKVRKY